MTNEVRMWVTKRDASHNNVPLVQDDVTDITWKVYNRETGAMVTGGEGTAPTSSLLATPSGGDVWEPRKYATFNFFHVLPATAFPADIDKCQAVYTFLSGATVVARGCTEVMPVEECPEC